MTTAKKICPCSFDVEDPGEHIPECPFSDPDYAPPGFPWTSKARAEAAEAEVARLTKESDEVLDAKHARLVGVADKLATLRAAARALVEALPRCVGVMVSCDQVATWTDGNEDYCDGHHASETEGVEDEHLLDNWAELPHAAPLRALRAKLDAVSKGGA